MVKVFCRSPFNYDMDAVSVETGLRCEDESLTLQSQAAEADINTLVKRFGLTGLMPQGVRMPSYGDFMGITDYRTALDALREADEAFYLMPAEVRSRFRNDPSAFVDFCSDAANLPELRKLGLALPEAAVPPVMKVEVVNGGDSKESVGA